MDTTLDAAMDTLNAVEVAAHKPGHQSVATGCAVMKVSCLAESNGTKRICDQIEIILPGDDVSLHVAYRTPDGRPHRIFVRGPQVSVIPAGQPYAVSWEGPECARPTDVLVIALDRDFFAGKARDALGCEPPELVGRYGVLDSFMRELGNSLRSELQTRRTPSAAYLESLAGVIAIPLAKEYAGGQSLNHSHAGLPPHKPNRVKAFIAEHFGERIRVEDLAAAVHMSPWHFARMFKKATGLPPHPYVTVRRMERAKELLRDSELQLVDVAASVGFQTQGHFTGVFHKYAGVTPRVFRLNCLAGEVWQRGSPAMAHGRGSKGSTPCRATA